MRARATSKMPPVGRIRPLMISGALMLALVPASTGLAAVCANLASVDTGFGSSVTIHGQATGPVLGGLMYWNQVPANAPSLWNGRDGYSTSHFVSIALDATWNCDLQSDQTYHFKTLQNVSSVTATGSSNISPLAAAYIGQLWARHMAETVNAKNVGFAGPRRTMIGAMQTAIWKLVYDQGLNFDLSSGNVQVSDSSAASVLAQQWLNELQLSGPLGPQTNLVAMVGDQGQVHITAASVLAQTLVEQVVPEPEALWAWSGFIAIGLALRVRQLRMARRVCFFAAASCSENVTNSWILRPMAKGIRA